MDGEHIMTQRLVEVAASDDLLFTADEFRHLKGCAQCFDLWAEFIKSLPSQQGQPQARQAE
jgi:hypothetical protein